MKKKQFFIERTNKNGSFEVIGKYTTYEEAWEALKKINSNLRHELWRYGWADTEAGYTPMDGLTKDMYILQKFNI